MKDLVVVIMAGGLGTRMNSDLPKVIHKINGIPMINYIIGNVYELHNQNQVNVRKIFIVVGKYKPQIKAEIDEYLQKIQKNTILYNMIEYVHQENPMGTGHAIQCCVDNLKHYNHTNTLILSGDVPLFSTQSMYNLIHNVDKIKIMVTSIDNPHGYGRIVMKDKQFDKIVEHNDCNDVEINITKVNCGIYVIDTEILCNWVFTIQKNNKKGEYYLTDIVEIIKREENTNVQLYELPSEKRFEVAGVNNMEQLKELEKILQFDQKRNE
jgi:UDP-N-acetylglucosamine diphosphorylase/glucosamine-1-phosphate N-acetyltransferase